MIDEEQFAVYERVCKDKFEQIITRQDKVLAILQGTGEHAGLVEEVRSLKRVYRGVIGALGTILVVLFAQVVNWVLNRLGS